MRFNGPPECYDLAVLKKCSQSDTEGTLLLNWIKIYILNFFNILMPAERLAGIGLLNTVSVSIRGQSGHALVAALGEKQVRKTMIDSCRIFNLTVSM